MDWGRETSIDENGMEITRVFHSSGKYVLSVYSYGATVVSWGHDSQEMLFVSKKAILNGTKAIRGGVPIVFPQFGQPNTAMPQHGIARTSIWTIDSFSQNDRENASLVLTLEDSPQSLLLWPYKFQLVYTIKISLEGLYFSLVVSNTDPGPNPFQFNALFHTYFSVDAIESVVVNGLQNTFYSNKLENNNIFLADEVSPIIIEKEVDNIHINKSGHLLGSIVLYRNEEIEDGVEGVVSQVTISKNAYIQDKGSLCKVDVPVDVVVWNPWIEKSKAIADLDDDAYLYFICIEPGVVSEPVTLSSGNLFVLEQFLVPRK